MTKRLATLLAALLLVLGCVVTGCGDDDESDSGGSGDTAAETVTDADTATQTGDETETDDVTETGTEAGTDTATEKTETAEGGGAAAPTGRSQVVESCKRGVGNATELSTDAKEKLVDICEQAGSGDPEDVLELGRKVCQALAEDRYGGDVPDRERVLEACKSGGQ